MATPSVSAVPSLAASDTSPMSTSPSTSPHTPVAEQVEVEPEDKARADKLKYLLDKSQIYARIIGERMERQQRLQAEAAARKASRKREGPSTGPAKKKRRAAREVEAVEEQEQEKPQQQEQPRDDAAFTFQQPSLVTGAKLRGYQLAGVQWMTSLYENGLNGILADEMGLGKTLQTISFFAHLRSKGTWGPFLIVCPLSVLHNWVSEFEKFAPSIPVIMYHGSQEHRAELRSTRLQAPAHSGVGNVRNARGKKGKAVGTYKKGSNTTETFPIIITTFEICMRDQPFLSGFQWKFIVVDEGHRLKNLDCRLIRELKSYKSANRMILTGTPLHNNLAELWSLLNFILPDIFDNLDAFQQWFNFDEMENGGAASLINKGSVVQSLHAILKPFLLRRLKAEVEDLPPKKEYLLYAPLTQQQKDIYQAILNRNIKQYLIERKVGAALGPGEGVEVRGKRTRAVNYHIEESDHKWLQSLEGGEETSATNDAPAPEPLPPSEVRRLQTSQAAKEVGHLRLQNITMQLRKVSSHPFLFDWPVDPATNDLVINADLAEASGKMLLLNRLLDALFSKGHKVLIFSQFTTMLDVIQDWATLYKKFNICRIDGTTSQESRREQMHTFNTSTGPEAPNLFLLSTRAGGLGINLVAADTVIFFDQDWNPQMDLQAQDRAHRIGQTKPVLVFRLVSQHTIETKILLKAGNKRRLEALVIKQGKFGKVVDENGRVLLGKGKESTIDMARALLELDEEAEVAHAGDSIIGDADLELLLDRSDAAFAREKGWAGKSKGEKTAFEVFVPAKDDAADGLAHMFTADEGE